MSRRPQESSIRAAEADLPPIPLWCSPALLFTCSPALCRFPPAVSPARKSLTRSGTSSRRDTVMRHLVRVGNYCQAATDEQMRGVRCQYRLGAGACWNRPESLA